MSRLPQVNGDKGNWGRILNTWLKHVAGFRGVAPARPASGSLPAGVAVNGTGYDTTDQYQSENSGLNFHNDFPANAPTGFTFIHTVHNRIYRREGNDWAVLLEGYTPQTGEHLWRRVSTGSPNIRNVPVDGFVGVNTDPDFRLHVLENRNDTIALFEGGSNNDIAEVKIFNSSVRSRSRPGGGTIVGGDALLTFETTNNAVWSVGITADYNNDSQRDNFFVISVNNRFGPYNQNDPSDDYLIITPNNGAVGIGNNYVPNTNLPPSATLPNNGFYKLDVQGNANVWEQTTTRNFRMWDQNPQPNSVLTSVDTQGNAVWRDFVTLGIVTNAENIPINNAPATDHGWSFAQKVGTVLQFRKITAENQNHGTLFRVRTDGDLIRIGLTGGNNGDIIWRNRNTGVYEWTNPSSIRDLLGLGTLTVGPLASSAGVIQVNPNSFNPATSGNQNINIGFTGGSNGQLLTVNNGTYQWASAQTLNLVTDAENIPQSAVNDPNNHGLSYFGKNGTLLQFRAIQGENLIRTRTDNQLIRVGLTGGQGNQPQMIVYNFNNSGTYTWQNIPDIRPLLGLGTLTLNNTTPSYLSISPNTYNPNNNQTINIGLTGDLTQRGSLLAGANVTLTGPTANRLVGSGDVTVSVNVPNMTDADWFIAGTNNIPQNINDSIWTNGRVGIGTSNPGNFSFSHNFLLHVNSNTDVSQIAVSANINNSVTVPHIGAIATSYLQDRDGLLPPESHPVLQLGFVESEGANRQIIFRMDGYNHMTILGNGRVRIGRLPVNSNSDYYPSLIDRTRFGVVMDRSQARIATLANNRVFESGITVFQGSNASASRNDFLSVIRANYDGNPNISQYRFGNYFSVMRYDHSPRIYINAAFDSVTWCWAPPGVTPPPGYSKSVNFERGMLHVALNVYGNQFVPPGYPGVPPITKPNNINSTIIGLHCAFDESQRFNNVDYEFIHCYNSREVSAPPDVAGIFVVHARGHMYLYSGDSGGAIAYKNGTTTWTNPSDARLKTNIAPITGALDKILKLRGVNFDWINQDLHKGDTRSGFLAQEMEQVFPDCVQSIEIGTAGNNEDAKLVDDGKIKTVGLTLGFFATIVEAIKEQQQMIEELQKTVAQQQQLIELQNQKIAQLEQKLEELANKLGS